KRVKEITKLEGMSCVLKRQNFAGKNGIYDVRCHQLSCPTFLAKCLPVSFWCVSVGQLYINS
ncbi:hypothetical protein QR685DRAFT_446202, partial [Neurospora intermedia]